MKVWRFYIKPKKDSVDKAYTLYALTNNKEKAKIFMETRNMDRFYTRCTKEDKDVYTVLANENRDCVLDFHSFTTKTKMKNGFYGKENVSILSTEYEHISSTDEYNTGCSFNNEYFWNTAPNPKIFSKQIKNALSKLQYNQSFYIFNNDPIIDAPDYASPDFWIDEYGVFIQTFKDTFKL